MRGRLRASQRTRANLIKARGAAAADLLLYATRCSVLRYPSASSRDAPAAEETPVRNGSSGRWRKSASQIIRNIFSNIKYTWYLRICGSKSKINH